jgi:hypothetical protein
VNSSISQAFTYGLLGRNLVKAVKPSTCPHGLHQKNISSQCTCVGTCRTCCRPSTCLPNWHPCDTLWHGHVPPTRALGYRHVPMSRAPPLLRKLLHLARIEPRALACSSTTWPTVPMWCYNNNMLDNFFYETARRKHRVSQVLTELSRVYFEN